MEQELFELLDEYFVDLVNELDSYNGIADGFRCWPMDELNDFYYEVSATQLINDLTPDFNINDDYFYNSCYGLESTNDVKDLYTDNMTHEELLDNLKDNYYYIDIRWISAELDDMIESLLESES